MSSFVLGRWKTPIQNFLLRLCATEDTIPRTRGSWQTPRGRSTSAGGMKGKHFASGAQEVSPPSPPRH